MYVLIGLAILMTLLVGGYAWFYLNRTFEFYYKGKKKKWMKALIVAGALLFAIGGLNPFGLSALIIYYMFAISVVLDLIYIIANKAAKKNCEKFKCLVSCGIFPILLTALILGYGYVHMHDVKEKTYDISSVSTLNQGEGYHVAFLSDLHFGTTMNEEKLQKYSDIISAENPDILILGGDIVDERTTKQEMEKAFQILGGIKSKYGIFYVSGNHDSAGYSSSAEFGLDNLYKALDESGIHLLDDQAVPIGEELLLVGRKDKGYGNASSRADTAELLQGQDLNRYVILVDHQPLDLQKNAELGIDLQLGGHTHGGQIWPVGLISDWLGFGEMNYGMKQIGDYTILVSSGIAGWGYPIRTGSQSEYLIISIK